MLNPPRLPAYPAGRWIAFSRFAVAVVVLLASSLAAQVTGDRKAFDVPAGEAQDTLKVFARQAGQQLFYPTNEVRGLRTRALRGRLSIRDGLDRLLDGTGLKATVDQKSGTFAVAREFDEHNPAPATANPDTNPDRASGTVTGQISNAATTAFLEGARVGVRGSSLFVLSDRQGRYQIAVPSSTWVLEITYTGLDAQTVTVSVPPGARITQDVTLTSSVYRLATVTVEGEREGSARSVTLQRRATNVKNVVSTDAFGNIANGNVGDFLQRLPGITGVYIGSEVVGVSIRGLAPSQNAVMMDGDRVASSDSAGTGRGFVFEQTSLNLIESVEVTKAPTPDMDADSTGGNVNMVTKSAFDRVDARYFSYAVGFSHRWGRRAPADSWVKEPIKGLMPSLNFTYSDIVGENKNLGILLTGTWHVQATADIRSALDYQNTLNRPAYVYSAASTLIGSPRSRFSLGAKVDYKLSPHTVITLNSSYSWMHDSQVTQQQTFSTGQALATFDANGNRVGTGTIVPNFTDTFTEVLPANNSLSTLSVTTIDKTGGTYQFKPSVRHRFDNDRLVIDYNASWSRSDTFYDAHPYGAHYKDQPKGTVSAVLRNIGWTVDRSRSQTYPDIVQTAGPDAGNLANYSDMILTQPNRSGRDEIMSGRFNLKRDFDQAIPITVKTGFNYRLQKRAIANDSRRYTYIGAGNISKFLNTTGRYQELVDAYRDEVGRYTPAPYPDAYAVAQNARDVPGDWREDITYHFTESLSNERSMSEGVGGAYLMANVRFGGLTILGGVRVEETRTEGSGPLRALTPAEVARRASWVGPVTAVEAERRVKAEYAGRLENSASYQSFFPGLHFKYETKNGWVARASHTNGIGRPDFGSIMPNSTVNFSDATITYSNPALKPQYSENFDVSLEYYFEPVGLISVGAFTKNITDFIFQDRSRFVPAGSDNGFNGDYEGYNIITSANGGSARYRGLEFSFQQQLTFLPGFLKGLGVNANYTYLETKGDYGGTVVSTQIAGFKPRTSNIAVSYRHSRLNVMAQWNWVSSYLQTNSSNAALLRYERARTQVDLKMKYTLSRTTSVFCDVENLFSEPLNNNYLYSESRSGQTRLTTPKIVAGIQGRF